METRSRRRHWIMIATATLNCVALGGVASVVASSSATAAPSAPVLPAAVTSQATGSVSTDAAPKHCQVTLQFTTPFTATDGFFPSSRLTQIGHNFYGVTGGAFDGDDDVQVLPGGTFRLTDEGKLTTLDEFPEVDQYGDFTTIPNAGLVRADDGNLYGTTWSDSGSGPVGTVFRMTPGGTITTIYTFTSGGAPLNGLVEGPDGALYGMTYGSVYRITTTGKLTTLHVFDPSGDLLPGGPLLLGRHGVLYGLIGDEHPTTSGTIFSITPDGKYRALHTNVPATFGEEGGGVGLVQDSAGNLYSETQGFDDEISGEVALGAVFKLTPKGSLTTLYSFDFTHPLNGYFPSGGLTLGRDGNLYGVTEFGGVSGNGTIFRITPNGQMTIIYNFTDGADGAVPAGGLTLASNGYFYGTNFGGTSLNVNGTAFRFKPPLADCREQ
jgi:uncharacterized repeat protein (TIGR03803 family)